MCLSWALAALLLVHFVQWLHTTMCTFTHPPSRTPRTLTDTSTGVIVFNITNNSSLNWEKSAALLHQQSLPYFSFNSSDPYYLIFLISRNKGTFLPSTFVQSLTNVSSHHLNPSLWSKNTSICSQSRPPSLHFHHAPCCFLKYHRQCSEHSNYFKSFTSWRLEAKRSDLLKNFSDKVHGRRHQCRSDTVPWKAAWSSKFHTSNTSEACFGVWHETEESQVQESRQFQELRWCRKAPSAFFVSGYLRVG